MKREDAVDGAAHRLDRAVAQLETRLKRLRSAAGTQVGGLFDHDRDALAAALDAARERELALKAAAQAALQALDQAIAEIRQPRPAAGTS
jgi:hypothetical protein